MSSPALIKKKKVPTTPPRSSPSASLELSTEPEDAKISRQEKRIVRSSTVLNNNKKSLSQIGREVVEVPDKKKERKFERVSSFGSIKNSGVIKPGLLAPPVRPQSKRSESVEVSPSTHGSSSSSSSSSSSRSNSPHKRLNKEHSFTSSISEDISSVSSNHSQENQQPPTTTPPPPLSPSTLPPSPSPPNTLPPPSSIPPLPPLSQNSSLQTTSNSTQTSVPKPSSDDTSTPVPRQPIAIKARIDSKPNGELSARGTRPVQMQMEKLSVNDAINMMKLKNSQHENPHTDLPEMALWKGYLNKLTQLHSLVSEHVAVLEKTQNSLTEFIQSFENSEQRTRSLIIVQSRIRSWLSQRVIEKRKKMNVKRRRIVGELLDTERSYVNSLSVVSRIWLRPLQDKGIVSEDDIKKIYSEIEVIFSVNSLFYLDIEKRVQAWKPWSTIGDLFLSYNHLLQLYVQYLSNYTLSISTFEKCKSEIPAFVEFLDLCKNNPECTYTNLSNYLIMPIQRIPRYSLLLEDLLKNTWTDHQDYSSIETAHHRVVETTNYIDSCKAESDVLYQLTEVQSLLTGKFPHLVTVGRQLLKSGDVFSTGGKLGDKKVPTRLYLFTDLILFTEPVNPKYKVKSYYNLTDITSVLSTEKLGPNAFQIITATTLYTFLCEEERIKKVWVNLMNKQLTIAKEKQEQDRLRKEQSDNRSWSRNTDKAKEILLEAARAQTSGAQQTSEPVPETGWARNTSKAKQLLLEAARLQMNSEGDSNLLSDQAALMAMAAAATGGGVGNSGTPVANSPSSTTGSLSAGSGVPVQIGDDEEGTIELRSPKKRNKLLDKAAWSKRLSNKIH